MAINERYLSTQYHHYIPQFMLRRFAIESTSGCNDDEKRHKRRNRNTKGKHNKKSKGNEMVNAVNLIKDPPEISTMLIKRIFGIPDMYKDDSCFEAKDQMRMESKLGQLERAASVVIARIVDAHRTGKDGISLRRDDKDLLRKFLFVMKYRSPMFFRRFNHQTAEGYSSNDRVEFLRYMHDKKFKRPLDVWFHNLTEIIDMAMDPECNWAEDLVHRIYPGDAFWVVENIRAMHLVFVTPSDASEEFILTENAFSIHEGPVSYSTDYLTNEQTLTAYTEFHLINVISPHLAMILRNNYLPEPMDDLIEEVRAEKMWMLAAQAQIHSDAGQAMSLLHDLPVAKARNSYTVVKDGRLELAQGHDGRPRAADMFKFLFFRLGSEHTQTINAVMLDQAHRIKTLVFKSDLALRKALEFYLSYPTQTNGSHSMKTISEREDDPMLRLFHKLEKLAHSLGSNVKATYHIDPIVGDDKVLPLDKAILHTLKKARPIRPGHHLDLPMHTTVAVLTKTKLDIRALHAHDLVHESNNRLPYPDLIYKAVQDADPMYFNTYTKLLSGMSLELWRLGWNTLVEIALERPGKHFSHDVEYMENIFAQLGGLLLARKRNSHSATLYPEPEFASQIEQKIPLTSQHDQPQNGMDENESEDFQGFSKRGLRNAFDRIGRQIQKKDQVTSRPEPEDITTSQRDQLQSVMDKSESKGFPDPELYHQIDYLTTSEPYKTSGSTPWYQGLNLITFLLLFAFLEYLTWSWSWSWSSSHGSIGRLIEIAIDVVIFDKLFGSLHMHRA